MCEFVQNFNYIVLVYVYDICIKNTNTKKYYVRGCLPCLQPIHILILIDSMKHVKLT
jgi:hypothetical protein